MNHFVLFTSSLAAIITGIIMGTLAITRRSRPSRQTLKLQTLIEEVKSDNRARAILIGWVAGGTLGVIAFLLTQVPLALSPIAIGPVISLRLRAQKSHKVAQHAIEDWPEVLEDLRIRVGSLGIALPQAFFLSARKFHHQMRSAVEEAERLWVLGGSFAASLHTLSETLNDAASSSIFETLIMCYEGGGYDIASRIEDLRDAREADRALWGEIRARLGSVKVARIFVIVVPGVMGAIGFLLGGSTLSIYSGLGLVGVTISITCVLGCWFWSSALMKPPNLRSGTVLSASQLPRLRRALSFTIPEGGELQ